MYSYFIYQVYFGKNVVGQTVIYLKFSVIKLFLKKLKVFLDMPWAAKFRQTKDKR